MEGFIAACITTLLLILATFSPALTDASMNQTVPKGKILSFLENDHDSNSLDGRAGNKTQKILTRPLNPQTTTTTTQNPYNPQYSYNPQNPQYFQNQNQHFQNSHYLQNPPQHLQNSHYLQNPPQHLQNPLHLQNPQIPQYLQPPGYIGGDSSAEGSGLQTSVQNPPMTNNFPNGNKLESKGEESGIPEIYVQLIGAIEKLVGRMDKLDNRLRTAENILYHMTNKKELPEKGSCPDNFSNVEGIRGKCYQISSYSKSPMIYDWKKAENECTKVGGRLIEMLNYEDFVRISQFLIKYSSASNSATSDYWIGGINPGLIWIWADSGQPVEMSKRFFNDNDNRSTIPGCLKLSFSHRLNTYFFKHSPCDHSQNYICEIMDNTVSRALAHFEEQLWNESETL